ncbi:MAG: histidine phosphatase family protein [Coriobacteriia bacterium]
MTETVVLIVRHPETEANVGGIYAGRGSYPFTSEGLAQAKRLPGEIAAFRPDAVWSSPLERTLVVAREAAELVAVPLHVDDRLLELDFGHAEGLTYSQIHESGLKLNYYSLAEPVAPGGESREALALRVASIATEVIEPGKRIAIVSHGGIVRSMLVHLLGLAPKDIWAFKVHNAQLATVRIIDGHGMLEEYVQG